MKFPSSSTICQSLPKWQLLPKLAETCSNFCKAIRLRPLEVFSFVYPGNKLLLTAKTLKNKKVIKLGLLVLWRKDNAPLASSTNLELSKFLLRKRRVNFGKKKYKKLKTTMKPSRLSPRKKNIYFENLLAFCRLCKKTNKTEQPNLHDTFEVKTHNNNSVYIHSSVL